MTKSAEQKLSTVENKPLSPMEREYWDGRYATKEFVWTASANRFVAAEVASLSPGRALDLAAGEGRNAVWLAGRGWSVCAVDFSSIAIEKGKQLAAERNVSSKIDFQVADLRNYEPDMGVFDLVTLIYLQIPQAELAPIIARAAGAVALNGTFLLVAHDSSNLAHGYGGPLDADLLYTTEQVLAALGGQLDIEKACAVERPVETDSGVRVAIDCLVRGKRHD